MEFNATFLISAISFLCFVFIMNKILYAPVLKIMEERKLYIENNYKEASLLDKQTVEKNDYKNSELEKHRNIAREKVADYSKSLKSQQSKQLAEYKNELFAEIEKDKELMRNSAIEAKEVLKDSVVDIAKEISFKLLGNNVDGNKIDKSKIEEEKQ